MHLVIRTLEEGGLMNSLDVMSSSKMVARAVDRGILSTDSEEALREPHVALAIEGILSSSYTVSGVGSKVLLVTLMPDDSGSMAGDKRLSVMAGHNELLHQMSASPAADHVMMQTRLLGGRDVSPFSPLSFCSELDESNYQLSSLGTPLFSQSFALLGSVLVKAEELGTAGCDVQTATLVMTDGEATDWTTDNVSRLNRLIAEMSRSGKHVIAGMGFGSSRLAAQFKETFRQMGIAPQLIFLADSRSEILDAFSMFARTALQLTTGV